MVECLDGALVCVPAGVIIYIYMYAYIFLNSSRFEQLAIALVSTARTYQRSGLTELRVVVLRAPMHRKHSPKRRLCHRDSVQSDGSLATAAYVAASFMASRWLVTLLRARSLAQSAGFREGFCGTSQRTLPGL